MRGWINFPFCQMPSSSVDLACCQAGLNWRCANWIPLGGREKGMQRALKTHILWAWSTDVSFAASEVVLLFVWTNERGMESTCLRCRPTVYSLRFQVHSNMQIYSNERFQIAGGTLLTITSEKKMAASKGVLAPSYPTGPFHQHK